MTTTANTGTARCGTRRKIVLLGMMTRIPVAGAVWGTMHYLVGLERLGYEPYYVEAHARTPTMLMRHEDDDSSALAAGFIDGVMRRFGMADRWAFHALHDDGRVHGMSDTALADLYRDAAMIINYHGGTVPLPEHTASNRLVYLGTDPVDIEIEVRQGRRETIDFLAQHQSFWTWGLNLGRPDCRVPLPLPFDFKPMPPAVVCDLWESPPTDRCRRFTTVGNWRQPWRDIEFEGEVYHWSKHHEFMKVIDLPRRVQQEFELSLGSYEPADQALLESHGWHVRDAMGFSTDLDLYRDYLRDSRGEFTVAKDQNVRLKSGWFSERSAQYLAAGRPVITQETGFSNVLPTGRGVFGFASLDDIVAAVEAVNADHAGHCRAAREIAREHFDYSRVLPQLLEDL
jgi:hypothetical protein